ncbi:MAG: FAD-dependent oxidoreductase [Planctomycetota bacterium]
MSRLCLSAPDLSDHLIREMSVGLRPFRETGYRLESVSLDGKRIVHNYGHGGAGVTLSYGCAFEVADSLGRLDGVHVAVLGGGVMGVTSANVLACRGARVTVFSQAFSPHTTSDVAGAQWSPSYIEVGQWQREQFGRILRRSFDAFVSLLEKDYGVYRRPNYTDQEGGHSFRAIPHGVLPPREELDRLPWHDVHCSGHVYQTLLIEPSVFLARLMADCELLGVAFMERRFESVDEVLGLQQDTVVNCLGLGAGRLFDDPLVHAVRGQLVLLEPQDLPWLLSHRDGYVFPRSDALVLGGTVERGETDAICDESVGEQILQRNRNFFTGGSGSGETSICESH